MKPGWLAFLVAPVWLFFVVFLINGYVRSGADHPRALVIYVALLTVFSLCHYLILDFTQLRLRGDVLEWRQFPTTRNTPLGSITALTHQDDWLRPQGSVRLHYSLGGKERSAPILLDVFRAEELDAFFSELRRRRPDLHVP